MILAFGDSLTFGFGVGEAESYPSYIRQKTDFKIINAGVNGEFSSQGSERLPRFLEKKPETVILCHGANDILNQYSMSELKNNLRSMIALIKKSGAKILFVGVPNYHDSHGEIHPLYLEIAQETGLLIEDKVLSKILKDSSFQNDYVHPNAQGYQLMADTFLKILRE